jgi:3-oxoacyl-[acyl-carrier protein] reductase
MALTGRFISSKNALKREHKMTFVKSVLLAVILLTASTTVCFAEARMKDKVVLITGGSKGIGLGITKVFAAEGAKVVILSRTEADLKKVTADLTAKGAEVSYLVGDISESEDMQKMVAETTKKYGRIDVFIHNAAGLYPASRIDKMTEDEWHTAIQTNLNGVFYAVKAVVPVMKDQKYGRIILTSSISGPRVGLPGKSHYTAAKSGMNGFMKTIAIELAKYNITVNAVEPGNIETEGLAKVNSPQAIKERIAPIPMKRLGTPEEVAFAHLFLASDEARYITGQSIIVDGGQTLPETHYGEY